MADKLNLTDLENLENETAAVATLAENNAAIETAIDNTLSRDGSSPNEMNADLDMNSHNINNLAEPTSASQAATKAYVDAAASLGDAASLAAAVDAAEAAQAAAETAETNAETAQAAAEAAAAALTSTSATSHDVDVNVKLFVTQAGKQYTVGDYVMITSDADPTNYMTGPVTIYSGTDLTVDVQQVGGSGNYADWTIRISGAIGATGATGAAGAAGAAGADYTADPELNALAGLTATPGLLTQTVDDTFTTREIAGTTDLIEVTNPAGVGGNPTINVGANVVRKDQTGELAVGYTHTVYDHGNKAGVADVDPEPALGALQKTDLAAASDITINAPTTDGFLVLQITNTGAPTSVVFDGFDAVLPGATFDLTINKIHWVFIYSIGAQKAYQLQLIV